MSEIVVQNIPKISGGKSFEQTLATNASSRLQKELDYISKNEAHAEVSEVASELVSYSRELGYYTRFHDCIGSSLVVFLRGYDGIPRGMA